MKHWSTLFLKIVICLIAVGVVAILIRFPQTEGRATHVNLLNLYTDPFILYIYIASIPFFVGLYQAFKLLSLIDAHKAFSQSAVTTLRNIKFASLSLIGFIALAELYIHLFVHGDDPAGSTMFGIFIAVTFGAIATTAGIFQKLFQNAVALKSENDLTV